MIGGSVERQYQTYRRIFRDQALPFAFVDLVLLSQNAAAIARRAGSKRVRIASKSVRSRAVLAQILALQPNFAGVMCYSVPEALFLHQHGFDDLLLGYPCWQPAQIAALCDAAANGRPIVAMVDSLEHVTQCEAIARERGVVLPLCLDLDMSVDFPGLRFGVWRSPVRDAAQAQLIGNAIRRSPHLRLDGLMGYEAQIAGVGDQVPGQAFQNRLIRLLKRISLGMIAQRRRTVVRALQSQGHILRFVNGGGTGSLTSTAREDVVTEITAGSGFYSPGLFDYYQSFRFAPAAGFAIEIVRRPTPEIYTCLGGGYVASGAAGPTKLPLPYLPQGASLLPLEGAGEVQTPIRYQGPEQLQLGDPVFFRHSKAGELCEHFAELLLVAGDSVVGAAPTYRGEGKVFL